MTKNEAKVSILFVCMGNICRSPTAEGVFRKLLVDEAPELDVEIDSAGTHAYHTGEQPDLRAQHAAMQRGFDLSAIRARKVKNSDFERFDFVLAMDSGNYELLNARCPSAESHRLRMFLEFAPGLRRRDVPDPYYGGSNGFEQVLDIVEQAARGLLDHIRNR